MPLGPVLPGSVPPPLPRSFAHRGRRGIGRRVASAIGIAVLVLATASKGEPASAAAPAHLPRDLVDTSDPPAAARTIHVPAGGDLQAALNSAQLGDVVTLQAGATYAGRLVLPRKEGVGWIVVRTNASDSQLASGGARRVSPEAAPRMARLTAPGGAVVALAPGAHHYRLIGLEITV